MRRFSGMAAVALAVATTGAWAESLTFDGYLQGFGGETSPLQATTCGKSVSVVPGTNGYVNVTVEGIDPSKLEKGSVEWTFTRGDKKAVVTQILTRAAIALVADRAEAVRPRTGVVELGALEVDRATAGADLSVDIWQAPGTKVVFGGDDVSRFTVSNAEVRLSLDTPDVREGRLPVQILGAAEPVEVRIAGGESVTDERTVVAPGDGLLEVLLSGKIEYSKDQGYGPGKTGLDGVCRLCAMVGLAYESADGAKPLADVFGAFEAAGGLRPWIVPASETTQADGKMISRLTLPMRRGDRFTLKLAYAEFYPGSGRSAFSQVTGKSVVGAGSSATGVMSFHAFGGER